MPHTIQRIFHTSSRFVLILAACLSFNRSFAQHARVINSSEQSWSGGIAGRYGNNYSFTIEFSDCKQQPELDTLWVGGRFFKCILSDSLQQGNTRVKVNKKKKTVTFDINVGYSGDEYAERNMRPGEKRPDQPKPPAYNGVALLQYSYKGKARKCAVANYKKVFPPINYP
jgi:hypothetical protein